MTLIKALSTRIEDEQTRKLQQLGGRGGTSTYTGRATNGTSGADETDFESLVTGRSTKTNGVADDPWDTAWDDDAPPTTAATPTRQTNHAPKFSWSSQDPPTAASRNLATSRAQVSRTVTPDQSMSSFASLAPSRSGQPNGTSAHRSQPLQPAQSRPAQASSTNGANYSNWPAMNDASNPWASSGASTLQPQPSSASNPWASIPNTDNWGGQTGNLRSSLDNMKIAPPAQGRGPGAFGQTQQKQSGSLGQWESLL